MDFYKVKDSSIELKASEDGFFKQEVSFNDTDGKEHKMKLISSKEGKVIYGEEKKGLEKFGAILTRLAIFATCGVLLLFSAVRNSADFFKNRVSYKVESTQEESRVSEVATHTLQLQKMHISKRQEKIHSLLQSGSSLMDILPFMQNYNEGRLDEFSIGLINKAMEAVKKEKSLDALAFLMCLKEMPSLSYKGSIREDISQIFSDNSKLVNQLVAENREELDAKIYQEYDRFEVESKEEDVSNTQTPPRSRASSISSEFSIYEDANTGYEDANTGIVGDDLERGTTPVSNEEDEMKKG